MPATRRKFLGWMALALGVGAFAWAFRSAPVRRWLLAADLAPAPPGPLHDSTAATLRAAVFALLDPRVQPGHYVEFFRWRAQRLPGARALYERFEAAVDQAARAHGAHSFRTADRATQKRILEPMRQPRGIQRISRWVLERDDARFSRHIVREIFRRFARTDAWVISGYDAWPGIPRGVLTRTPDAHA